MRLLSICLAMIDDEAEQEKFEQLYWHYKNLLSYRAKELLFTRELVDDALNITFARIAANMHMVGEVISPRTKRLLVVTLEHVAFNLQKEEKRQKARTVALEKAAFMETEMNSPTDNIVAEAILQLSSPYQEVLLLKYAEGYTNKEIAQLLQITVANVEKRLSRGKKQLKKNIRGAVSVMKLHDAQLRRAAILAMHQKINRLPEPAQCAEYVLSPQAERQIQALLLQARQHCVPPARIHFGWQYYTKRGAAVLLLGALLTGITAPDLVQAAYQRLIDAVETVFDAYTQYRYTSHAAADTAFVPLTLQYLPEGMQEVEREERETSVDITYIDENGLYFNIYSGLVTKESDIIYGVDTENAKQESVWIQNEEVIFIYKENRIQFIWLHDTYQITGQTNLSKKETTHILEQVI